MIDIADLTRRRISDPECIPNAWRTRQRAPRPSDGRLLLIAADHPARGALTVRGEPRMADRRDLLRRLAIALARPGVDGVLGTPDILEDLLLAGLLEDKVVIGSMNRGGLQGATFELDDRFTAYDVPTIVDNNLDGGKMLTRIARDDAGSVATLAACGDAVTALATARKLAMIEPFLSTRRGVRRVENLLDADSVISAIAIASGLGASSAYTWLKLPVVAEMERVLAATTLPTLLLGGDPAGHSDRTYASWAAALAIPPAAGLVVGRALLYPPDDDVAAAVDIAAQLVHGERR